MVEITIRQEEVSDHAAVFSLVGEAFLGAPYSSQDENFLVERLRASNAFLPELSLVAEHGQELLGHILLSKVQIISQSSCQECLSLAPVSVRPGFQKKGIGGRLINQAHQIAKELGYPAVVLIGHTGYYPRFGYVEAAAFGVTFPFDSPSENCMIKALLPGGLETISGMVTYPAAFFKK